MPAGPDRRVDAVQGPVTPPAVPSLSNVPPVIWHAPHRRRAQDGEGRARVEEQIEHAAASADLDDEVLPRSQGQSVRKAVRARDSRPERADWPSPERQGIRRRSSAPEVITAIVEGSGIADAGAPRIACAHRRIAPRASSPRVRAPSRASTSTGRAAGRDRIQGAVREAPPEGATKPRSLLRLGER